MENASEALKLAASVLVFVMAITVTIALFSQARETSEIVLQSSDVTSYYDYQDYTKKDSAVVRRQLQSGKQKIFCYEIFEKLDLSKGDYRDLEFQYSSFDNSNLSNSDMTKCI